MLKYLLVGSGFAFAAAVQPGPLQAYLLSQVAARGWKPILPASFAPLLSDGPIAFLALVVLGRLSLPMQNLLRAAGGALLLFLAVAAFRQWQRPGRDTADGNQKVPRTLLQAALVNFLNPNPYLGWALILGPAVVAAWQQRPANAVVLVVAFYGTMVLTLAAFIFTIGAAHFLGPRGQRALLLVSALILAGLGVYQLLVSLPALMTV